ncbi:MAG TPA: family 43 glycosylhydrolase [archaeon]|nr:family 43 glycosylhydrolase [archaeon]
MKRRSFLEITGKSVLLTSVITGNLAGDPMKNESAFKLSIGRELPDPFCIKTKDGYYLTGTSGLSPNSDYVYVMFHSLDLKTWTRLDPILKVPEYEGSRRANYWAPEILPYQGKFYLYYTADSFGDPERRFVRVAVGENISGPYEDCKVTLTKQPSIDGDPFFVSEDEGYLFYTGNEGNDHVGQLLVDRLISPTQAENQPRKVFPAESVEWEEGAFVIRANNSFYLFTSQGNWRDGTYHVLVAKADKILGPYKRLKKENGDPRVLKTQGLQIGPGHNSIFTGPDSKHYICYHAWDKEHTGRYPWIAPIEWENDFPVVRQ